MRLFCQVDVSIFASTLKQFRLTQAAEYAAGLYWIRGDHAGSEAIVAVGTGRSL